MSPPLQAPVAINSAEFLANAHLVDTKARSCCLRVGRGQGDADSFVFGQGLRNKHEEAFIKRRRKNKWKKKAPNPALLKAEEVRAAQLVPSGA